MLAKDIKALPSMQRVGVFAGDINGLDPGL
jgi:hypothetical protein